MTRSGRTLKQVFRRPRIAVALLAITLTLSACFTGQRPSFAPVDPASNDPAIAAVLQRLQAVTVEPFTASYSILTKFGNITTEAAVTQVGPSQNSVTIAGVRYLFDTSGPQTCDVATASCQPGTDDARISNLSTTHAFYADAAAARLRQDAAVKVGAATASTQIIGGQTATCVLLPFTEGNKLYCVLDNGLLALQDTPDLRISLVSMVPVGEPALMTAG